MIDKPMLLVFAETPFPPQETPPKPPAAAIKAWQQRASALAPASTGLSADAVKTLTQLPPFPILSMDPTRRLEESFDILGCPLTILRSQQDVPVYGQHTLLKLGGDLPARSGLFLSWDAVRAARDDPDKRYLLSEAARQAEGATVILYTRDPDPAFLRYWELLLKPILQDAAALWVVGPEDFPWPAPLVYKGTHLMDALQALIMTLPEELISTWLTPKGIPKMVEDVTTINTGGGSFIMGDVRIEHGDFVGHDQITTALEGSRVISEAAAETPKVEKLRIDTAAPDRVTLGQAFELAVAVRQLTAPVLKEADLPKVSSGEMQVIWPKGVPAIKLRVQVSAPACEIHGQDSYSFRLYEGQDSPIFYFQLTPKQAGRVSIVVTVYQEEDWLGSARVHTLAYERLAGRMQVTITSHALDASDLYAPVDIRIFEDAESDDNYPVELHVPGGRDFPPGELRLPVDTLRSLQTDSEAYGRALGEAFFAEAALGDAYQETLAVFQAQGRRPRIHLQIDPPALHAIRWERLTHRVNGSWYPLAATADALLSRYVATQSWEQPIPLSASPLRILVILASPKNLEADYGLASISDDERAMWHACFDALPNAAVTYLQSDTAAPPTLKRIQAALLEGCHLVHCVCHGKQIPSGPALFLEAKDGSADVVEASQFLEMFRALTMRPHACFLAACESGAQAATGAFIPLGPALVAEGGIPAVVAMAERVGMTTAREFADTFYTRLFTHGAVDLAVHEARAHVRDRWDWSVPVLFSRLPDNQLLALPEVEADGSATNTPAPAEQPNLALPEVEANGERESTPLPSEQTGLSLPALRKKLQRLDDVEINTLCLDHFPKVYDKFSRGTRRDEKINLLLDHCRRHPEAKQRLAALL